MATAFQNAGVVYHDPRVLRRAVYSWALNKNAWVHEPREELGGRAGLAGAQVTAPRRA